MNKKLLLTLAAGLLTLAACSVNPPSSSATTSSGTSTSSSAATSSEPSVTTSDATVTTSDATVSSSSQEAPTVYDGGIVDLEVGVDADIEGVVAQILKKGFTLADGKGAVYVYGEDSAKKVKVGDQVNVTGEVQNYYGVYEIAKPSVTVKENPTRGLADIVKTETELTEEMVGTFFNEVKASAGEGKDPYAVTKNVPYKLTGVTAVANGSNGGAFKLGESKLLCPHYYVPANNRSEEGKAVETIDEGVKYDVKFYLAGTNSSQNVDIHIYDVKAYYETVESVTLDVDKVVVEPDATAPVVATVNPAGANPNVEWTIADTTIATVNNKGVVKGVAVGETTLTVKSVADSSKTVTIPVIVKAASETVLTKKLDITSFNEGVYAGEDFVLENVDATTHASYNEFDLPKKDGNTVASITTGQAIKGIKEVVLDIYGSHNDLKVYAGEKELTNPVKGDTEAGQQGKSFTYTYSADYVDQVKIVNPSTSYGASLFSVTVKYVPDHEPGGDVDPSGDDFNALVSYDFSGIKDGAEVTADVTNEAGEVTLKKYGGFIDNSDILPFIQEDTQVTGENKLAAVTAIAKAYFAQAEQGPKVKGIKLGSSSGEGSIKLTFQENVTYSKIQLTVYRWSDSKLAKITVNGTEKQLTTNDNPGTLLFEFAQPAAEITISSSIYSVFTKIALA